MRARQFLFGFLGVVLLALGCVVTFGALREMPAPQSLARILAGSDMPTVTASPTLSATPSPTFTPRPTRTPTPTETPVPPTATPPFTPTPTETLAPSEPTLTPTNTPTRRPTNTPLPSGRSDVSVQEMASAALVGNSNPSQPLPGEIEDCRWVQQNGARIACKFYIFLPPGYFDGNRRYPVLYLLHGWGGWDTKTSNNEYNWYGTFGIADEMMRAGEIPPFIIVVPEGDRAYWMNHAGDERRWGDYVSDELVSFVDANYRTLARRESRAIGGLSMGGLGSIQLALNHPDEFSIVGMRSPTLRRPGDADVPPFFGDATHYAKYDPLILVQGDAVKRLTIYIIIGDKDIWLPRTQEFRALLDKQGAKYEWYVYPGEHDGTFFGSRLDEELRFYGANLSIR